MKSLQLSALALVLSFGFLAHAEKAVDAPACASLVKSCEAAGFEPGEHKKNGKGIWVDCVGALAKGKTVAGVTASQADAKACAQAAKADRAANKAAKAAKM
jgi:GH24 family phage-related lysozyme (muramidase)